MDRIPIKIAQYGDFYSVVTRLLYKNALNKRYLDGNAKKTFLRKGLAHFI